jgi:NAD(P)-dependent dehydrogenase (short-subunit alcohol dehydrogenase family)
VTALVTGGGGGIGRATALRLARDGGSVAVADIRLEAAQAVAEEIERSGRRATAICVDVTDAGSAERMVRDAIAAHGSVDVLVSNAGWDRAAPSSRPMRSSGTGS